MTEDAGALNVDLNLEINEDIIDVSPSSSSPNGFALYRDVTSSRELLEYEDWTEPSPRATSITMTAGDKVQTHVLAPDAPDASRSNRASLYAFIPPRFAVKYPVIAAERATYAMS